MVALVHARGEPLGGRDREPHLDGAALELAHDLEADVLEDLEHRAVVREHLGEERLDPERARARGELLQEPGAEPLALELVGDHERDLRRGRVTQPREARQGDDPVPEHAHERASLGPVGLDEGLHHPRVDAHRPVEAQVAAPLGEPREERDEGLHVVATGRPQPQGGAVAEDDVCRLRDGRAGVRR